MRPHPAFQEEDDGGLARVAAAKMQRREWTCEGREELIRMTPRFGAQETKLTSVQSHPCLLGRQALKACSYSQGLKTNLREIMFTVFRYVSFFSMREIFLHVAFEKRGGKAFLKNCMFFTSEFWKGSFGKCFLCRTPYLHI